MKLKLVLVIGLALILALPSLALPPQKRGQSARSTSAIDNDTWIDVNLILMFVSNYGAIAHDFGGIFGRSDGLYYPFTSVADIESGRRDETSIYQAGVWIGGIDAMSGDTLVTVSEFSSEYFPGPMVDSAAVAGADTDPKYRVYKIFRDSLYNSDPDVRAAYRASLGWGTVVEEQNAPYVVEGTDTIPDMIGDQMLWSVYTDADGDSHETDAGNTDPIGVEIRQTVFGFNRTDPMGNVIFVRYRIYNKGTRNMTNTFLSLWCDPDLGSASDDLVGCDTLMDLSFGQVNDLGYCYNGPNQDPVYGSNPPAVGFDFFQGPLEFTGDLTDTAKMWGTTWPQYRNQGMTSFNKYINGTDPDNFRETYYFMQGLDGKNDGDPILDHEDNPTLFFGYGDPVSGEGFLDSDPADRRWMQTTGPFDFNMGDSTEILAAVVLGRGADKKTSITAMRFFDTFAQGAYDIDFELPAAPQAPDVLVTELPGRVVLEWGNESIENPGDYVFEGYTISQGVSAGGPWTRIANYDIKNGLGVINDDVFDEEDGVVLFKPVRFGEDGDLRFFISITDDAIRGVPISDVTDYYYRVEAYSYDPSKLPRVLASQTVVTATPQPVLPGNDYDAAAASEMATQYLVDTSQFASTDRVFVEIVDPTIVTGHDYEVRFVDPYDDTVIDGTDTTIIPPPAEVLEDGAMVPLDQYWELWDVTENPAVRLLDRQYNKSGNVNYRVVDGIKPRVVGKHVAGGLNDIRFVDGPSGGGDPFSNINWGGSYYNNGWDYGINFFSSTLDPETMVDTFVRVELRLFDDVSKGQRAYAYTRGARPSYGFTGYFECPFQAWDVSNPASPRQLNVAFVENYESASHDSTWFPGTESDLGDREYVFILSTDYSGDDPGDADPYYTTTTDSTIDTMYTYDTIQPDPLVVDTIEVVDTFTVRNLSAEADSFDVLYAGWPAIADDAGITAFDDGDLILMEIALPSTSNDRFAFSTTAATFDDKSQAKGVLDEIRAVPNPYYLFSNYDPSNFTRELRFMFLPEKCTISIYNLAGDLVRVLEKDDTRSWFPWDTETFNGVPVASGIYIFVVDAPGIGQHIGKMAIFTEEEQLDTY